jgi:hypothetical protein
MSSNTVKNILSLWIFAALVALGIGLVLLVQQMNAAPEDSKAAVLTATTIEVGVVPRTGVSASNLNLYNLNDTVKVRVKINNVPTSPAYTTIVLKVQYAKGILDPAPDFYVNSDPSKYLANVVTNGTVAVGTSCTPTSAAHNCARVDISRRTGTLESGEVVAELSFVAKSLTTAATAANNIRVYPDTVAGFIANQHSYLANPDTSVPDNFALSANAKTSITVEDQCYGDYDRKVWSSGEIVGPNDLGRFAQSYGLVAALTGDALELDIDTRTDATKGRLDLSDLSVFAGNYGLSTCNRKKSQGLP